MSPTSSRISSEAAASAGVIHLLLVEDNPTEALLLRKMLAKSAGRSYAVTHVTRLEAALARGPAPEMDVILLDLMLPDSSGMETVESVTRAAPDVPIVVLTNVADEAMALQALRRGAQDYVLKGRFDPELIARVIGYAIERHRLVVELRQARASIKTLSGLLPLCAWCKKIRNDTGYWSQLDAFIELHSNAVFSHGICPDCQGGLKWSSET